MATASTQFFRNVGSTVGIALFGTVMTSGLAAAIAGHLPAEVAARMPAGSADAGSVLDPAALAGLPPVVADAVRQGLADQLHLVFLLALPLAAVVFLATWPSSHCPCARRPMPRSRRPRRPGTSCSTPWPSRPLTTWSATSRATR